MQNARQCKISRQLLLLLPLLVVLSACAPTVGIFASSSWQAGTLLHEHIRSLAVDPFNAQNIYAGDAQNGVFVSSDGGITWKQRQSGLPADTAINTLAFNNSGKKLYAATDVGIYVSTDAAKSWTIASGLPQDRYTAIAFDLNAPQTIYVGSVRHSIFASQNSGASWATASAGLPANVTINGLAFDSDAHQLWAATSLGIYRSPDGGANWQALNSGLPADINVYTVLPATIDAGARGLIYAGTDKGFYLSQDAAAHWQTSQTPLSRISIYAVTIDFHTVTTVYIATGTVGILRSLDSGKNWQEIAQGLPAGNPIYALAQGAANYDQLFVADNNVYFYPGTNSIFDPSRLFPFVLIIAFFYFLIRMSTRRLNQSRNMLKPERIIERDSQDAESASPTEPTNTPDEQ